MWRVGVLPFMGARGFPFLFTPLQRGKHAIQFQDDTQVLEDGDEIALAKKSKSGPQGDLPLQL